MFNPQLEPAIKCMKRRFQLVHGIECASELEKSTDPSGRDKIEQTAKGEPEATTMFKFSNYMYVELIVALW